MPIVDTSKLFDVPALNEDALFDEFCNFGVLPMVCRDGDGERDPVSMRFISTAISHTFLAAHKHIAENNVKIDLALADIYNNDEIEKLCAKEARMLLSTWKKIYEFYVSKLDEIDREDFEKRYFE